MSTLNYSTTPGANTSVDNINIAEGMPPGNVNNAMRAMMADSRKAQLDTAGATTTAGSGNTYTAAIAQAPTAYANGLAVRLRFNRANTGAATLNLNGVGAQQLRVVTSTGYTALVGGEIKANAILDVVYRADASGFVIVTPVVSDVADLSLEGNSLVGRNETTSGPAKRINVGNGLEFNGNTLRVALGAGLQYIGATLGLLFSTQAQAEGGTNNDTTMTPLRVRQSVEQNSFGYGQSRQDMRSQRQVNTTYQNTTGKPIFINAYLVGNGADLQTSPNGTTWTTILSAQGIDATGRNFVGTMILPGERYRYTGGSVNYWFEIS